MRAGPRLVAVALAGLAALNYPLLAVADTERTLAGVPALVIYLFAVWASLIAAMALIVERRAEARRDGAPPSHPTSEEV